jgi:hypothetical protein
MIRVTLQSLFIAIVFLITSCSKDEEVNRNTIDYFSTHLQKEMTHSKLLAVFGEPDKDLGSGIHIYVYNLDDATEVWVGITDKILYANHVNKDRTLLKVLI